ncbi:short-chain dehydrogenase [Streptomyces fumigatiscleroticus]|nr:short-chain dehydrogenase [Streptomyces fumigatiscleroticus]
MPDNASPARSAPVAVVTGAGRGIGLAVAARLAADGHHVVLSDLDGTTIRHTARALGNGHTGLAADVTDPLAVARLAEAAVERYGRLDVWINNAGLLLSGPLADFPHDVLLRTVNVNITGVLHGCRAALTPMLPARRGHIVNIASVCAVKHLPGLAVYSATKAGVLALSGALRREVRSAGIHVSALLPYLVDTPAATGLRPRVLRPLPASRVADAVVRVLARPRAEVSVPGYLGPALKAVALLPAPVRDWIDDRARLEELALDSDHLSLRIPGARVDGDNSRPAQGR